MLSLGEKTSKAGPPWDDVIPIARAYIEAAPDRCVWASDWPHPVSVKQPPNDADLLELMYRYAPDAGGAGEDPGAQSGEAVRVSGLAPRHCCCEKRKRRSNPGCLRGGALDCFAALAMTGPAALILW